MSVWALADTHLSFGVPDKEMSVFGKQWENHPEKIRKHWLETVSDDDLVLLPGDISWAMKSEEAKLDLDWIDRLPGTKVMIKGNHDYWWQSLKKIHEILPSSIHVVQNNVFVWKGIAIGGTRLWDTPEYSFGKYIPYVENPRANALSKVDDPAEAEKIFVRELHRLEMSLKQFPKDAKVRLAMTHYPPIGADLSPSRVSALLEKYQVEACAFGHLHNVTSGSLSFGKSRGVNYVFCAGDYVEFKPVKIL